MKYVQESLKNEIKRMLFLAGNKQSTKTPVNESKKPIKKSILKEDDDDGGRIFSDFEDELARAEGNEIFNPGRETVELSTAMKMAMVLNSIQVEDANLLGAFTGYNPRTRGSQEDPGAGTIYSKRSVSKLPGAHDELNDMNSGVTPVTFHDLSPNATKAQKKDAAKWLSHVKDRFIISYAGNTLTPTGKAQIEMLARLVAGEPLDNEDEDTLLKSLYANDAKNRAYGILYDFYMHAMMPIMVSLGNRTKYSKYDLQLDIMLTNGLEHALEQTSMGKYDHSAGNYGAWIMKVIKNYAIDYLRKITEFSLDEEHVYNMLSSMTGDLTIASKLDPEKAYGNYDDVVPNSQHPDYWNYIYKAPMNALSDFQSGAKHTEEGRKASPLQQRLVLNPSMFFKGRAKNLTGADIDMEHSYQMDVETTIPVPKLPAEAKQEIYIILDSISSDMIANYKEYGIKNISSNMKANREFVKDLLFALLGYGGMVPVYKNSFISKSGNVYPGGSPAKFNRQGELEEDNDGVIPEVRYVWTVRRDLKSDEGIKTDFTNSFKEKSIEKYGEENLPPNFNAKPKDFVNKVYGALKQYFGNKGGNQPIVKTNRDKLDSILLNYSEALGETLGEAYRLRKTIQKVLSEIFVK